MYTPGQAVNEHLGRACLHVSLQTISMVSLLPGQAAELHQQQITSDWLFQVHEAYLPCLDQHIVQGSDPLQCCLLCLQSE